MLRATLTGMKKATAVGALSLVACSSVSAGWFEGCGRSSRPYFDPSCEPNWGVQETNWRRFPSSGQYGQGSYCPDGGCQPSMDASYMNGAVGVPIQPQQGIMAPPVIRQVPSAGATAQPLLIQPPAQQMQLPGPGYSAAPAMSPLYEAPAPAIPYGMSQPSVNSAPMMNMPQPAGNAAPLMAPQPSPINNVPLPQPMGGQEMSPMNTAPSNGGSSNPIPMPMESLPLPPMPGANRSNQYQSPFNNVGYPVYSNQPGVNTNANYGQPVQVTPSVPVRSISYQGQASKQQPASKNPFSAISRMWSRKK